MDMIFGQGIGWGGGSMRVLDDRSGIKGVRVCDSGSRKGIEAWQSSRGRKDGHVHSKYI